MGSGKKGGGGGGKRGGGVGIQNAQNPTQNLKLGGALRYQSLTI